MMATDFPSDSLILEWTQDWELLGRNLTDLPAYVARRASIWAASRELAACCDALRSAGGTAKGPQYAEMLYGLRRPTTADLRHKALKIIKDHTALASISTDCINTLSPSQWELIRQALKASSDDQP